jgi:hypothetical protein
MEITLIISAGHGSSFVCLNNLKIIENGVGDSSLTLGMTVSLVERGGKEMAIRL